MKITRELKMLINQSFKKEEELRIKESKCNTNTSLKEDIYLQNNLKNELKNLYSEKEILLKQLSQEKDFNKIQTTLRKYGIEIKRIKIKMLTTEYDQETNIKIWDKDQIFEVNMERSYPSEYLIFTNIMGMDYGVSTDCEGTKYIVVEE